MRAFTQQIRRCSNSSKASGALAVSAGALAMAQESAKRPRVEPVRLATYASLTDEKLPTLTFERQFLGHLTPPLPATDGAKETATGGVLALDANLTVQAGPFGSVWMRVSSGPLSGRFQQEAEQALKLLHDQRKGKKSGAALYVAISEDTEGMTEAVKWCKENGFKFHQHHNHELPGGETRGELVYYKWAGEAHHKDMVPSYATSIEGVAAVIFSPDEKEVLLVWEYGNWKFVTGAVDARESCLQTVKREAEEEVGIKIDGGYQPRLLGGWQIGCARDLLTNDNFHIFGLKAASKEVVADDVEITHARWFPIKDLLPLAELATEPHLRLPSSKGGAALAKLTALPDKDDTDISTTALFCIKAFASGASLPVNYVEQGGRKTMWYFAE